MLRCQSTDELSLVNWALRSEVGGGNVPIVAGCSVLSRFSSVYNVTREDSTRHCDLVVESVTAFLSGVYSCAESFGQSDEAYLTIIGQSFNMLL